VQITKDVNLSKRIEKATKEKATKLKIEKQNNQKNQWPQKTTTTNLKVDIYSVSKGGKNLHKYLFELNLEMKKLWQKITFLQQWT